MKKLEVVNVYDWHRQDTRATELNDLCVTASASWGGGGNNMPYVVLRRVTDNELSGNNGNA